MEAAGEAVAETGAEEVAEERREAPVAAMLVVEMARPHTKSG